MLEMLNLVAKGKKSGFSGEEVQKILANDGLAGDSLGYSIAFNNDGSILVLGATGVDDKGTNSGAVYVLTKQPDGSYAHSQKLLASDGAEGDRFGYTTAISSDGSTIVVGAHLDDDKGEDSGSVYVFTKQSDGNYLQSQKLTANDGAAKDYFGHSVSISNDSSTIVVGAYYDDDKGTDSGSVYVFTKQSNGNYTQSQKLVATGGKQYDYFGYSVAISGDGSTIAVGAYRDSEKGTTAGAAYVFTKQTSGSYTQSKKLTASDGFMFDNFGISVTVSGDGSVVVVGAYYDDARGQYSGSAYVFTKQPNGSYVQSQKITAIDGSAGDYFGWDLVVSDDSSTIVVGSYRDADNGTSSGSAHVFVRQSDGSYLQSHKLVASDGYEYDYFGHTVAVNGDGSVVAAGSTADDDLGSGSGSVYIFK